MKNFEPNEIKKFEDIASDWWNLKGNFKSLHQINSLRIDYFLERTKGFFDKKVLDIGCGGGICSEGMAKEGAHVTGLEIGEESLKVAISHALKSGLKISYFQSTVEKHALDRNNQNSYDIITCLEVLEHVPEPSSVISSCSRLVKTGGHVFFSTINRNIKSYFLAILCAERIFKILPKYTHNYHKFIRPSELIKMLNKAGLKEFSIIGVCYYPILNNYKLSKNIDVNYIIHSKKI
ncbi:3-demethylubiquinone-9 3-O-methyltransferase [Candidatus Photodesmus katoptron Akat1]|uniref:Ubiquinone biosynthesis O-methyltransferase n=2 Tax=Candidatus Photodesmus anomalopis TaxID=28176 RepID=S3E0S5_9GAMM|nr:3-demethylubiquinone-9 3-O-methyltransferase [Candidatus Photodesmus katoptron Akat1]